MKFSNLLFWKSKGSKRKSHSHAAEATTSSVESETFEENKKQRPRSASFSGVNIDTQDSVEKKSPKTKKRRSNSMGHKVKRRNSFIRLFKAARDIGKTLRQMGDDLESRHSHSSQSICSQLK